MINLGKNKTSVRAKREKKVFSDVWVYYTYTPAEFSGIYRNGDLESYLLDKACPGLWKHFRILESEILL